MRSPYFRPLTSNDHDQWRRLYQDYADFYHFALTNDRVQTVWSWLINAAHACSRLVAEQQRQLAGPVYFRGMPSSLRGQMIGSLDDLFVLNDYRFGGVAATLIRAVQAETKAQGWGFVPWITRDHDYRALGPYDKLAEKLIGYRMK